MSDSESKAFRKEILSVESSITMAPRAYYSSVKTVSLLDYCALITDGMAQRAAIDPSLDQTIRCTKVLDQCRKFIDGMCTAITWKGNDG